MGGRGSGKTRTGAEDISDYCRRNPNSRIALVAPRFDDIRDVMVEGESGLLSILPPSALASGSVEGSWNRSIGELFTANGCHLKAFTSQVPGGPRGKQFHRAWVDEPAEFYDARKGDALDTTWNNLELACRLGKLPQIVVTGTPKSRQLIRELLARRSLDGVYDGKHDLVLTHMSTYQNLAYLAPSLAQNILKYEGTRIGHQEIEGKYLEDIEGALWKLAWIDRDRIQPGTTVDAGEFARVVIALDPAGGDEHGDEQAWCVAARHAWTGDYYVLEAGGMRADPTVFIRHAAALFDYWHADRIVYEKNYGDKFLTAMIRTLIPDYPATPVTATAGKRLRAEPIAALYEMGRVHHVGYRYDTVDPENPAQVTVGDFVDVETQMTAFTNSPGEKSPDRLDALVYALTALKLPTARKPDPVVHVAEVPRDARSLLSAEL